MLNWIKALLDPETITQSPASAKKHISPPPKFEGFDRHSLPPPSNPSKGSRGRHSASPSKTKSDIKNMASPRKSRQTKAMKEANEKNANAASATLQAALDTAAETAESESINDERVVRIEVDSAVDVNGDVETTRTNVTVEMPIGSAELPLPEDTEKMIETAKEMVEEARKLEAESSNKATARKRKSDELESDDIDSDLPAQPAKRARVLEEKLKRQQVRTRAVIGISATLAIGYFLAVQGGLRIEANSVKGYYPIPCRAAPQLLDISSARRRHISWRLRLLSFFFV